ncbi:glycosyl hydrolase 53 family protein [Candidatus Kaiserbacteria bacterium]|nr:glycosyl hydrolase 53 family protein [Candidatus Kaiserbacteria bacterium]USN92014.1 MAG: glycosyl hydrolase 53 family protein [Candidatus Nomurabacteria bacterium]
MKYVKWFLLVSLALFIVSLFGNEGENTGVPDDVKEVLEDTEYVNNLLSTKHPTVAKGNRLFGVGMTEGAKGFGTAFANAQELGVEVVEIVSNWDEGEVEKQKYSDTWLSIADSFYPPHNVSLALSVNPIDTNNNKLPDHLDNKNFNDPDVIASYKQYITYLATLVPNTTIVSVAVGNEIDAWLGDSKQKWGEYTEFFCAVAPHVRTSFPNAKVGVKITFDSVVNDKKGFVKEINKCADAVMTTYYPLTKETMVEIPTVVHADFATIVQLYPNKEILFLEVGYPSSNTNGSSETKQAHFYEEVLVAWDNNKDMIPLLNVVWLHDISSEKVNFYKNYYKWDDKRFLSYLSSLGIRTYDGEPKIAFEVLKSGLTERGW